jgi:hypothetical protein
VSTKEQTENLSLPTQLRACEEYCRRQGYEILERFHEEGESAKTTDRSQLQNLLTYCRLNKGRVHFVVVFNLTRFARVPSTTPQQRAHPDFPLRAFVRCDSCGRGLTGSWSKGRREYYAYYHCRPGCRAVNVTKAKLEGLFADELALLQPSPGYMRLLKESVLQIWKARKAAVRDELANAERVAKAIQEKLDRLDEVFSSSVRSTSTPTTATRRNYARSSRSPGSTVTRPTR